MKEIDACTRTLMELLDNPSTLNKGRDITIKFNSEKVAMHFADWLCESGEQEYWEWMRYRENEEEGDITAVYFEYHELKDVSKAETDPDRYGEYMHDWTIRTKSGRLSDD